MPQALWFRVVSRGAFWASDALLATCSKPLDVLHGDGLLFRRLGNLVRGGLLRRLLGGEVGNSLQVEPNFYIIIYSTTWFKENLTSNSRNFGVFWNSHHPT